jgi:hypothetical protein
MPTPEIDQQLGLLSRRRLLAGASAFGAACLLVNRVPVPLEAVTGDSPIPTLLVYNTAQGLLAGDLAHAVSPTMVQDDIDAFPSTWIVLGVGTTNQPGRTGEIIPDGTARSVRFWWADPSSPSQADVSNLSATPSLSSAELPFTAIGVANPDTVIEWPVPAVPSVHAWLRQQLEAQGLDLAAIRLEGTFGEVMTTVSYNIPPSGIPTGSVYSGGDFFRFGDYPSGTWNIDGVFADPAALQPVVSTPGNPIHLHGYQPDLDLGGHIVSALPNEVRAYIYPLQEMVIRPTELATSS